MTIKISIDCMGGDHGVSVTVPAALSFLARESAASLVLVGLEQEIKAELSKHHAADHSRITVIPASEVVTMDDPLEIALRRKKDSSMRVAINQVKQGNAQACVSAGNTAALMAISRYILKTIPGIDRPAICTMIPNQKNLPTYMLDLGANVDCEPLHLHQFAIMASVLFEAMEGRERPLVGLLNVGEEDIKGNDLVKQTAILLRADHDRGVLNFYGNVEGDDIFKGTVDIIVCDGFVGNVTLKAIEGLAKFVKMVIRSEFKRNIFRTLSAILGYGALKSISHRLNSKRYNGASMLGLSGLVFKSHGGVDALGFEWAIRRAYEAAKHDILSHISSRIENLMPSSQDPANSEFGKVT